MQAVQSEVRCIACGGERMRTLYRNLVSCVSCGLVFFPWKVTREDAAELYDDTYFQGRSTWITCPIGRFTRRTFAAGSGSSSPGCRGAPGCSRWAAPLACS